MNPSDLPRESRIWATSRWTGIRAALDRETLFQARLLASTEWRRRRRERRLRVRAAIKAYRQANGDERTESLKAGARILRQHMAQAQVDKEFELRQAERDKELNAAPPPPSAQPHPPTELPAPLEELETEQ